ncbi:hypothetical protein SAMN04487770_11516 [Butyrivibrio sp. ob235]|uniref:hypothetical protein n=1 Tax=Butyrivibrio sp. ob235 TaxID=1761780 RepID=UPI0008D52E03|nr:hypothetical protein [Butyrivibrio sp. ob235]SEL68652.1 hypothetical protein SAMN04487770_11516 [Butyrivibrio sp. ob235]
MKNKIVRILLTGMCAVTIATSLTGCGFVGIAYDVAKVAMDAKKDKDAAAENPGDTNYDDEVATDETTEEIVTEDNDLLTPESEDVTDDQEDAASDAPEDPIDTTDETIDSSVATEDKSDDNSDVASNDTTDETAGDQDMDNTLASDPGTTEKDSESSNTSANTASYLNADAQATLDKLESDYNKVKWGVQYSPTGMDYLVISVTPFYTEDDYHLIVGVTNLYNKAIVFDGTGYAKASSGENIGEFSLYESAVGPGNTAIFDVPCTDVPTGEIHWDEIQIPDSSFKDAYWESDWSVGTDNGDLKIDYTVYSADKFTPGYIKALVLDENGYVIDYVYDYSADEGKSITGTLQFYKSEFNGTCADVAFFVNPTVVE